MASSPAFTSQEEVLALHDDEITWDFPTDLL